MTFPASQYQFIGIAETPDGSPPIEQFVPSPTKPEVTNDEEFLQSAHIMESEAITDEEVVHHGNDDTNRRLSKQLPFTIDESSEEDPLFLEGPVGNTSAHATVGSIVESEDSQLAVSFSQELQEGESQHTDTDESICAFSESELFVSYQEIVELRNIRAIRGNNCLAQARDVSRRKETIADFFSDLFHNPIDVDQDEIEEDHEEDTVDMNADELFERLFRQETGGLSEWTY